MVEYLLENIERYTLTVENSIQFVHVLFTYSQNENTTKHVFLINQKEK